VDKNVLAGLALDESKTLTGIEPLYCSLFFQLCFSFLFGLFGAFHRLQHKKRLQVWTCSPFTNLKVLQEQQTHSHSHMIVPFCPLESWTAACLPLLSLCF
jgi:hypothetical protein